jgi:hypothetical protein
MWDLWWRNWHWDRFRKVFGCLLLISFRRGSPLSHIIWRVNNRPVRGRSSETKFHPTDMNNNNNKWDDTIKIGLIKIVSEDLK